MAEITLVTGGCRSGKSTFAEKLMLKLPGRHYYVATAPNIDGEMNRRIKNHRQRRDYYGWDTIEEQLDLSKSIIMADGGAVLVECLTLWVNNLIYDAEKTGREINEVTISQRCEELMVLAEKAEGHIIFVTNEVGMGVMPANRTARLFVDLAGRCNQIIAEAAGTVYMLVSGIPMLVKGEENGKS